MILARRAVNVYTGVICLKSQPERYDSISASIKRVSPSETFFGRTVDYMTVEPHPTSGRIGCYQSHLELYRRALEAGCDYVLVLEDDIVLNGRFSTEKIESAIAFLNELPNGWDILRINDVGLIYDFGSKKRNDLRHVLSFSMQAYLLPVKTMRWFVAKGVTSNHLDWEIAEASGKSYMFNQPMIDPVAFGSTNEAWFDETDSAWLQIFGNLGQKAFNRLWSLKLFLIFLKFMRLPPFRSLMKGHHEEELPYFGIEDSVIE